MVVLLVTLLALLFLFYIWSRGREQTHSVPSYFFNAVKVYALLGEEDAKVAARAAGKIASPRQRSMMLDYLNRRTSELLLETAEQNAGQNPLVIVERLLQLKQEMSLQATSADERAPDLILKNSGCTTIIKPICERWGGATQASLLPSIQTCSPPRPPSRSRPKTIKQSDPSQARPALAALAQPAVTVAAAPAAAAPTLARRRGRAGCYSVWRWPLFSPMPWAIRLSSRRCRALWQNWAWEKPARVRCTPHTV